MNRGIAKRDRELVECLACESGEVLLQAAVVFDIGGTQAKRCEEEPGAFDHVIASGCKRQNCIAFRRILNGPVFHLELDCIRQFVSALLPFGIDSAEFLEQAIGGFQRNRESAERLDAGAKC